ncbi:Sporulation-specific protein 5 [Pleurostoma richardsiae]|uniref:Sporulation-specific protein 5 n=1 Tax=Pleurostoma richardsiae TaxID=41990 RepID=A0AA38R3E8_9PEZI|nr:Sporulation-specific protein 5 [Pleurostoma richardsiae]
MPAQHDGSMAQAPQFSATQHPDGNIAAMMSQFGSLTLPTAGVPHPTGPVAVAGHHPGYAAPTDASVVYAGYTAPVPTTFNVGQVPDNVYGTISAGYVHQGNVTGGYTPYVVPYTPARPVYPERLDHGVRDVPGLDNRRSSYSTNATESAPGTPFFGNLSDRHNAPRVVSGDRSSSSYTTPSPPQVASTGMIGPATSKDDHILDAELEVLVKQEPTIPAAVPAVFTTPDQRKTLEQCLENRIEGNRNVYIRGLHPTTDDELLLKYASRFGEVEQSKAIIDTSTGACKGFGFAKFKDVRNSEKCIRGFYLLGYEVGFARESFNARLKAEGDEASTNLYISNLPKTVTETQFVAIFDPYVILSSKILRDSMGNSRGVGFARFESRDICEEIIKKFHGQPIERDGFTMQIRYADTPAQKELKRITAERRQYRTNEYNIGAYGTMAVGINPSIYSHQPIWNRRLGPSANNAAAYHSGYGINTNMTNSGGRADQQQSAPVSGTAASDDGSGNEGVTIVDSPTKTTNPVESSPSVKKETA